MICCKLAAVWAKHECPNCVFADTLAHSDGASSSKLMQLSPFVEQDMLGINENFQLDADGDSPYQCQVEVDLGTNRAQILEVFAGRSGLHFAAAPDHLPLIFVGRNSSRKW